MQDVGFHLVHHWQVIEFCEKLFMTRKYKNIDEFVQGLKSDTSLQNMFKNDPIEAAEQISEAATPLDTDVWIYRIVVFSLGLTVVATIMGILILIGSGRIDNDQKVPTILTAIGSAAIGALAGLLAPSPKKQ